MTRWTHRFDSLLPFVILLFFASTYYVYVLEICLKITTISKQYAYIGIYHVLLCMLLWCFGKVVLSGVPLVPSIFQVPPQLLEKLLTADTNETKHMILVNYCKEQHLPIMTRTKKGYVRKCSQVKPDRTHHCSCCETCVLKMDHHCPWMNNCISVVNYKSFILLLFYFSVYALFCFGTTAEYFIVSWKSSTKSLHDIQVITIFIVFFITGFLIMLFFIFHLYLLFTNTTALEQLLKPNFSEHSEVVSFNLGCYKNIVEVFGNSYICCCCPIEKTKCDGVNFQVAYPISE